jgi:hypothetical protein
MHFRIAQKLMAIPDMAQLKLKSFCAHGQMPHAEEASAVWRSTFALNRQKLSNGSAATILWTASVPCRCSELHCSGAGLGWTP